MPLARLLVMPFDKGADPFGQSGSDPCNDSFDQYLTFNSVNIDDSRYLTAPESTLLVSKGKGFNTAGTSAKMWKDEAGQNTAQRLRGEPPYQDQSAASPNDKTEGNTFQSHGSSKAAGPKFELLSLGQISLQSRCLKPPPSSPELLVNRKIRPRHRLFEGFHKPFQNEKESKAFRKSTSPIRKASSPVKMRRAQYTEENVQEWNQRIAAEAPKFDFAFQHTEPISPPVSGRASESSESNSYMITATQQRDSTFAWGHPISQQYAYRTTEDIESPLNTPPADNTSFPQSNMHNTSSNNLIYTMPHRDQSSIPWEQTSIDSDYNFEESTPYVEDQDSPIWWGNAATTPLIELTPAGYQRQNQHDTQSLAMQLQTELAYNANELSLNPSNMASGLMIQMPNSPAGQSFVVSTSPMGHEQGYFTPTAAASQPVQPHNHRHTHSQPHYAPATTTRQEKSHSHSHSRTESFSTSPSPRPRASSKHSSSKHSSKSHSSSRKRAGESHTSGQKAQKGSNTSMAAADFVNFTPNDSMKILTGVAPSGSSKTKARREKEAAEKTRRLSRAAVKAVQAVGGSIDTLVEEGLFDEPELEDLS